MEMNLSQSALRGVKWTSISQVVRQVSQYVTTIILAAILSPSDFGIMAIALIVISFLEIFKDFGTSSVVIQRDENSKEFLSSIFWANVSFGILLTILLIITSDLISKFFGDNRVEDVLIILSFTFAVSGTSIIHKALFEKAIEFQKLFWIETTNTVLSSIVAVILALNGYGVWSLVFQAVVNSILSTISYWFLSNWRPMLIINFIHLKSIFSYSINLMGYNVFNYGIRNLDYLLIGKFLGDQALGHYYIIYKIMLYPVQNVSSVISRVMFPVYSKIKYQENTFNNYYDKTSKSIAIFSFPLMIGLISIREPFTSIFFNSNWNVDQLANLILLLAPVGLIQSICSTTGPIYQIKNKTDWLFLWGIASSIVVAISFIIGLNWGVTGVAAGYLISTILLTYHCFKIPFKLMNRKVKNFLKGFNKILFASLFMFIILYLTYLLLSNILGSTVLILICQIVIGIIVYFLTSLKIDKENLLTMVNYIKTSFSS